MIVNNAKNVSHAIWQLPKLMNQHGERQQSRGGDVIKLKQPLTTVYENPKERVILYKERDANPYFHFMESLWMLAGGIDVAWISQFNSNIHNYSDDGKTFYGAYGYRWRVAFGKDQMAEAIKRLLNDPRDRAAIVSMWSPPDLVAETKDRPCNLQALFTLQNLDPDGKMGFNTTMDMTVFNRSNDMVWGAYGANAVHFSCLHEIMAKMLGVKVGVYYQVSNNAHVYLDTWDKIRTIPNLIDPYTSNIVGTEPVQPFKMMSVKSDEWFKQLVLFMEEPTAIGFTEPFFKKVASPMWLSYFAFKEKENHKALDYAYQIKATDWQRACVEWLTRRMKLQ